MNLQGDFGPNIFFPEHCRRFKSREGKFPPVKARVKYMLFNTQLVTKVEQLATTMVSVKGLISVWFNLVLDLKKYLI